MTMASENKLGSDTLHEDILEVRGVKTPVLKLGQLPGKTDGTDSPARLLMLVIPGNPGVPHFYKDFMQQLFLHSDRKVPVWAIGHAGHCQPPGQSLAFTDIISTDDSVYGLEAQISHKVTFIQEHIPDDVSLILIGHSIGCYMILNLMDCLPREKVLRSFMLFPTVERMAESPNGKRMTPILCYLRWMIVLLAFILSWIPKSIQSFIIRSLYMSKDCPPCCHDAILKTITPWTANFTTYLAKCEMMKVTKLQTDLIEHHLSDISWYYGASDHWCPAKYYENLVSNFPLADARLCDFNFKHAFVLDRREGEGMAKFVSELTQRNHSMVLDQCAN